MGKSIDPTPTPPHGRLVGKPVLLHAHPWLAHLLSHNQGQQHYCVAQVRYSPCSPESFQPVRDRTSSPVLRTPEPDLLTGTGGEGQRGRHHPLQAPKLPRDILMAGPALPLFTLRLANLCHCQQGQLLLCYSGEVQGLQSQVLQLVRDRALSPSLMTRGQLSRLPEVRRGGRGITYILVPLHTR